MNCPNCGAELNFKSSISIFTTCTHCQSYIVRHDMDLELHGKQSGIIKDMSPFQVGTRGQYDGRPFEMVGRLKVVYDQGTWSEWYLLYADGGSGWLAEAQGFYMMSSEVDEHKEVPAHSSLNVGDKIKIDGERFEVEDKQKISYAASEGELPFVFYPDYKGVSIDLRGKGDNFATLLYDKEGKQLFLGQYVEFDTFEFQNLRQIDGWDF